MIRPPCPRACTRRAALSPPSRAAVFAPCSSPRPSALADAFTPESGGSPNADDIDTLYKITLYIGIVIFLLVEGTLIWSLVRYRARRGGRGRPDPRQHAARDRLDHRRGADPRRPHRGHVRLPGRHQEPAAVGPGRAERVGRRSSPRSTSPEPPGAAARPQHRGQRPAVPLALRLPGRRAALPLPRDGRAHRHHRDARIRPPT